MIGFTEKDVETAKMAARAWPFRDGVAADMARLINKLEAIAARQWTLTAEYCEAVGMPMERDVYVAVGTDWHSEIKLAFFPANKILAFMEWRPMEGIWFQNIRKYDPDIADLHTWAGIAGIELREVPR